MLKYNKGISLELRQKASKVLNHFFKELKRNHGDINAMERENEESIEFIPTTNTDSAKEFLSGLVRVTDCGIALEVEVDVTIHNADDPDLARSVISGHKNMVTIYETEDSDSQFYAEHYKTLDGSFIKGLVVRQDTRNKLKTELDTLKNDLQIRLDTIRRNTARLVRDFGQECAEGIYTLAFMGKNPTWEGHSFYRIMVEDFGISEYELRDTQENYLASNDIHDYIFLLEVYEAVLSMTE